MSSSSERQNMYKLKQFVHRAVEEEKFCESLSNRLAAHDRMSDDRTKKIASHMLFKFLVKNTEITSREIYSEFKKTTYGQLKEIIKVYPDFTVYKGQMGYTCKCVMKEKYCDNFPQFNGICYHHMKKIKEKIDYRLFKMPSSLTIVIAEYIYGEIGVCESECVS